MVRIILGFDFLGDGVGYRGTSRYVIMTRMGCLARRLLGSAHEMRRYAFLAA